MTHVLSEKYHLSKQVISTYCMQICVLFLYYSYHFKVFLRVSGAHLSFHNARQLLTVGMAIVSCKIGAQSHGYLVSGFSTACRIPIAFGCGITLARR